MSVHSSIPQITFAEAYEAMLCAVEADTGVLLLGDPGIGKSALARMLSSATHLPLGTLLGSTIDPTDVGGLPVKVAIDGRDVVVRLPLKVIRDACDAPMLLFLDEISTAPPAVQAALLRLILDRVAGDNHLHPGTRIIAAANPPEQAPGGFELSAPLMGRLCVVKLRPSEDEVIGYFKTLGDDDSVLRTEAVDFALTCGFIPGILQIDIPSGCVSGNIPWGAPRSWERALRARAVAVAKGLHPDGRVVDVLTAGSVGEEAATAYAAVLKLRKHLPSVDEILADPVNAKVPEERQNQIAALGLVPRVAAQNTWCAWVFASHLAPEIGAACGKQLESVKDSAVSAPFAREGVQARVMLSAITKQI